MELRVRARDVAVPDTLVTDIERRLRLVLGRFGRNVAHVTIRLARVDGAGGRHDNLCRIEARIWGRVPLAAEGFSADLRAAAERAVDRIGRTVERAFAAGYRTPKDFPFPPGR